MTDCIKRAEEALAGIEAALDQYDAARYVVEGIGTYRTRAQLRRGAMMAVEDVLGAVRRGQRPTKGQVGTLVAYLNAMADANFVEGGDE